MIRLSLPPDKEELRATLVIGLIASIIALRPYVPKDTPIIRYSRTDTSDILHICLDRRVRKEDVKARFIEPGRIEIEVQRRPAGEENYQKHHTPFPCTPCMLERHFLPSYIARIPLAYSERGGTSWSCP